MGRPTKLTKELIEELCENIANCNFSSTAARLSGISEATYYEWKRIGESPNAEQEHPLHAELVAAIDEAEAKREQNLLSNIVAASNKPEHWKAAAYILEKTCPERYGSLSQLKVTHGGEMTVNHGLPPMEKLLKGLSNGDVRLLERLIAKACNALDADGDQEGEGPEGIS